MAEKEKTAEEKLDAIAGAIDAMGKRFDDGMKRIDGAMARMDAMEEERKADRAKADDDAKKRADAEKEEERKKADAKALKDAEEEEAKKKARDDAARADAARAAAAGNPELAARLAAVEAQIAVLPEDQLGRYVETQSRASRVAHAFGDAAGARRWHPGEGLLEYRRQFLNKFKTHSAQFKDVDLTPFTDKALDAVENLIYADAMTAASNPASVPAGMLRMGTRQDETGRSIRHFHGDPESCWAPFKYPVRIVTAWQTKFN